MPASAHCDTRLAGVVVHLCRRQLVVLDIHYDRRDYVVPQRPARFERRRAA